MKRVLTSLVGLLLIVCVIGFNWVKEFSDQPLLVSLTKAISVILGSTAALVIAANLTRKRPHLKKLRRLMDGLTFDLLSDEDGIRVELSDNIRRTAKAKVLEVTQLKCESLSDGIRSDAIFNGKFTIPFDFRKGSQQADQRHAAVNVDGDCQFQVIVGESGRGKSFELLGRVLSTVKDIAENRQNAAFMDAARIPVFLELKNVDQELDKEGIYTYIRDKASLSPYYGVDKHHLKWLIDQEQLIYFLDGLDEVPNDLRFQRFLEIRELARNSSIFFTCRLEVYQVLVKQLEALQADQEHDRHLSEETVFSELTPATYQLLSMESEHVVGIISQLDADHEFKREILAYISNKEVLLGHLSVPLIFNLFLKVFKDLSVEERLALQGMDEQSVLHNLWEKYDTLIVSKKYPNISSRFPGLFVKMRTYTVWIAKIMNEKLFMVERINPDDWLVRMDAHGKVSSAGAIQSLYYTTTRLFACFLVGVGAGSIVATPLAFAGNSILGGLVILVLGKLYGVLSERFQMAVSTEHARKWGFRRIAFVTIFVVILVAILVFVCAVYQGCSIPRRQEATLTPFFSVDESMSGILLGLFLGLIFSYRIVMEDDKKQYILPVEQFKFSIRHALGAGLVWGLLVGGVIGSCGVYIKNNLPESSFFARWLNPYLADLINLAKGSVSLGLPDDLILFLFALLIGFSIAFFVVAVLAGRYYTHTDEEAEKKITLNFGIKMSLRHGAYHALWIGGTVAILYGLLVYGYLGRDSVSSWLGITFGFSFISFLTFGGIEAINHSFLRINLNLRGISPLNYDPWFSYNHALAFIRGTGSQMTFYHKSLGKYFYDYPAHAPGLVLFKKQRRDLFIYLMLVISAITLLLMPFIIRYHTSMYWTEPISLEVKAAQLSKIDEETYLVKESGLLEMKSSGRIFLGTFTGYSGPAGVTKGFLGLPLKAAYNRPEALEHRHAALLFRKWNGNCWSDFYYANPPIGERSGENERMVKKGERLQFMVNDWEWQNNRGRYVLELTICGDCHYDQ